MSIKGIQTTVATAIHLGILQRHPATGALVETGMTGEQLMGMAPGATPASPQQGQTEQPAAVPMSRAATNFQTALRDNVPGTELTAAYADYVEHGTLQQTTVNRIASHLKISPAQALENLSLFAEALEDQRARTMARFGVDDLKGFDEWASRSKPEALKRAKAMQLTHGSTEGYRALVQTYFESLDTIDPERVLTANFGNGIKARLSGGRAILSIPGMGEMPYRAAVAQGIVRVR